MTLTRIPAILLYNNNTKRDFKLKTNGSYYEKWIKMKLIILNAWFGSKFGLERVANTGKGCKSCIKKIIESFKIPNPKYRMEKLKINFLLQKSG